ncbi:Velvet factor [Penicillium cf. griseofulvum]|nr:Velvet factor [Penicillium cf. griseofulvum]
MASRPPIMPPHNETEHSVSRITREGKQLTYKLSVMQQPERARACGAGAKSSADRRPVDPPPVVELRIFESDPGNDAQKTDITFAYNANFFLYATLDTARPIAHGRVGGAQSCPVLTGVPVAGIAYLDRPSQAGYFIFPDLSVRHEGRYRLNFHLYEEIKDAKDADKDSTLPPPNQIAHSATSKPGTPQAFLHFRLEVKSVPFTVYSAKKFPGLATSTSLSRIIAEQGCRVRIRRDVRMRRRGDKRDEDYDEERAAAYARSSDRFTTPDRYAASMERPRSNSNGSNMESPYGFVPPDRRPSAPDYGFQCPQPYQRPMPPAPMSHPQTPSYQSHLSFGSTPSHYPAPHMPATPPPVPPQGMYSPQHAYAQIRHPSNASEYEGTPIAYPIAPQVPAERGGYPKPSMNSYRMEPPKTSSYMDPRAAEPGAYPSMPNVPAPRSQTPNTVQAIPPLKPLPNEYGNQVVPSVETTSPSGSSGGYDNVRGKRMVYQTGPAYGKRSHEDTFGVDDRSMQNGMRPDTEPYPSAYRDFAGGESRSSLMAEMGIQLAYKRANGKMVMKAPPT